MQKKGQIVANVKALNFIIFWKFHFIGRRKKRKKITLFPQIFPKSGNWELFEKMTLETN